jgi:hypothetical protein
MPYTTVEIKKYRCALFSSGENSAKVSFYDSQDANFATAFIRPDSEALPAAYKDSDGMYRLYYKYSRLPDLLDILRNEKPVYLHFWSGSQNNTHIATGPEPVGEAEA